MSTITRTGIVVLLALSAALIGACGHNPFHQSYKKIAGSFYLLRWEDEKTYYIVEESHLKDDEIGGGALNGTALQIGWNAQYIVAKRYATFRGDQDGWMVINLTTKKIEGPISDGEETMRFPELKLMSPSEAWSSLQ